MKKITYLLCLSVVTAVLCGVWSALSVPMNLLGWAGFAGCTSYFACGESGVAGIKKSMIPNIVGVLCGMMVIGLSSMIPLFDKMGIWSAIITFLMCMLSKYKWFSFCPGTFVGCFTTFAAQGNYKVLIPSLVLGVLLGAACDCSTKVIYQKYFNS